MSFRELIASLLRDSKTTNVLFTLTPPALRDRSLGLRMLYAGGVVATMGLGLFAAASSALLLTLAIGVIYYLMSQVLGLQLDFDPSVLTPSSRTGTASAPN
jgi:hypothetical protein